MKRSLFAVAAICCALTFASCGNKADDKKADDKEKTEQNNSTEQENLGTTAKQLLKLFEEYTKKVKAADSQEDIIKLFDEFETKSAAIGAGEEYEPTKEEIAVLEKAAKKFQVALEEKMK